MTSNASLSPANPAASILIPTWNGARFLPACLDSLARQTRQDVEVVVVDNGSTDDTAAVLARYPAVLVLNLPTNVGFARGVNHGIRSTESPVVVLLNNDTEVEPTWLAELLAALEASPEAGMATSKVRLFDQRDRLHTTGDTLDVAGSAGNRGVWEVDKGQWDGPEHRWVFGANGAACAYRRAMLDEVGLLEEAFGSYLEDVDLAWRAQLAGWRCVYAPRAVVYHHLSATGGGPLSSFLVARNRIWLVARNYPAGLLRKHVGRVVATYVGLVWSALKAWRGPAARATLRGLAVGAVTWPRMLPARRRIQAARRITDEDLERLMEGESGGG